jgi:nitrate reductase NapE component
MQRLSTALDGTFGFIFTMFCRRAALMLWHAFLFLLVGMWGFFLLSPFCSVVFDSYIL